MKKSLPHDAYDTLADSYASLVDTKPHNAYYERPATLSLIGDVNGQTVLDAGCGPGVYAEWLLDHGAQVTALDANEKMLSHARERLGDRTEFYLANLEEPLTMFENAAFDGVLCPLVITYIRDHRALFSEFGRVLRPGGWLVFSTEHPFFSYCYFKIENYFQTRQVAADWKGFAAPVRMPSYYHSLGSIAQAVTDNHFVIEKILEPLPTDEFKKSDPQDYKKLMAFPLFICCRARKQL